jgi:outer membrane lipoprotein
VSVSLLLLTGCAGSQLVSSDMEGRISREVSFPSLQADPDTFRGRWVVLGGKVLNAKRLKHETQIEILQLPLDKADRPNPMLTESQGRFLAIQQEFLDPAIVPPGTFVSLVGEVSDAKTLPLDETTYTYPVVQIKTMKVWPDPERFERLAPGPYPFGPYWGWPYPFWPYPYPYPYRYWWP